MMRWLIAASAVAMLAGCQQQDAQDRVAQERQELQETQQEAQQRVAEERQAAQEDVQQQREQLAEAQQEAQQERLQEGEQVGQVATVTGIVSEASDDSVTIRGADGRDYELNVDERAQLFMGGQQIQVDTLQQGAQVRASYRTVGEEMVLERLDAAAPGGAQQEGGAQQQQQQ